MVISIITILSFTFVPPIFDSIIANNKIMSSDIDIEEETKTKVIEEIKASNSSEYINLLFFACVPIYLLFNEFMDNRKNNRFFKYTDFSNDDMYINMEMEEVVMKISNEEQLERELTTLIYKKFKNLSKSNREKDKQVEKELITLIRQLLKKDNRSFPYDDKISDFTNNIHKNHP